MKASPPPVDLILRLDAEYRDKAAAGTLKKIAPKKFNPDGAAWLPVMSTVREDWKCTVLFSNTQRAHDLRKTSDWVVVYYDNGNGEQKCTVVTEHRGPRAGKRVVRGREKECEEVARFKEDSAPPADP